MSSDSDDQETVILKHRREMRTLEKKYNDRISELEDSVEERDQKINVLKRKMAKLISPRRSSSGCEIINHDTENELDKVKEELDSLSKELQDKHSIIAELETQIESMSKHVENLGQDNQNLSLDKEKNEQIIKSKDDEIEEYKDQIQEKDNKLKELKEKIKLLNTKKEHSLSRSGSERSFNEENYKSKSQVLNEINRRTGKKFESFESCVDFIKANENYQLRGDYYKEKIPGRNINDERVKKLNLEIDRLEEEIHGLFDI